MTYVCSLDASASDVLAGRCVITTQSELYRVVALKKCKELVLRPEFVRKYFTSMGLKAFLENVEDINPTCRVVVDPELVGEPLSDVQLILSMRSPEDLINYLLTNRKDGFQLMQTLAKEYNKAYEESLLANNKLATLHLEVSEQHQIATSERLRREKLAEELALLRGRFETLVSRIQFNYNKNIDAKHMESVHIDVCSYSSILYFKEITRVRYIDTLVYYLKQICQILSGLPVRLLVIEAPYAYARKDLYPDCVPHLDLTARDVYKNDIFMAGFQYNLVNDILKNPSGVESLIVLDRSGSDEPHVTGSKVTTFYTVSDLADVSAIVPPDNLISYRRSTWHIPYLSGFENMIPEERIARYSSFKLTKHLLGILRGGELSDGDAGQLSAHS